MEAFKGNHSDLRKHKFIARYFKKALSLDKAKTDKHNETDDKLRNLTWHKSRGIDVIQSNDIKSNMNRLEWRNSSNLLTIAHSQG